MLTDIRISEIRYLKVSQILTLMYKNCIPVYRLKHGPRAHKAYLSKKGKKILANYCEDIIKLLEYNSISI